MAFELDPAPDVRTALGDESEAGEPGEALATSRLADKTDLFASSNCQSHPVNGVLPLVIGRRETDS